MEVNHDEVFGTTGLRPRGVRFAWFAGQFAHRQSFAGADAPQRSHRALQSAAADRHESRTPRRRIDVIHVDNAAPPGGNGTAEHPFNSLAAAQAASAVNDIIYVHRGNGTTDGYDTGIVLKNDQMLLGSGNNYVIQTTEVGPFLLKALDCVRPGSSPIPTAPPSRWPTSIVSAASRSATPTSASWASASPNTIARAEHDLRRSARRHSAEQLPRHGRHRQQLDLAERPGRHPPLRRHGHLRPVGQHRRQQRPQRHLLRQHPRFGRGRRQHAGHERPRQLGRRANRANVGEMDAEIKNNTIQYNTEGIYINATGTGTRSTPTSTITRQSRINQGDGIQIASNTTLPPTSTFTTTRTSASTAIPEGIGIGRHRPRAALEFACRRSTA